MRYSNKNLNNELTIKDLKQDEMFTLKNIEEPTGRQVWLKSHYDRSTKKFVIYNFDDIGKSKLIDASKKYLQTLHFKRGYNEQTKHNKQNTKTIYNEQNKRN